MERTSQRAQPRKRKILFLIRSLDRGGAQRQMVLLAKALQKRGHQVCVAVMYGGGFFEPDLRLAGIHVIDLAKRGRWEILGFFVRLLRSVRRENPEVLHSYLAVPNILAGLVKFLRPGLTVVWGVRASAVKTEHFDWAARLATRVQTFLSRLPDLVIVNSRAGEATVARRGFPAGRLLVIENGIDSDHFHPDSSGRRTLRRAWCVPDTGILIGLVGRLHPMKGHAAFLRAAALLLRARDDLYFVCVGTGPPDFEATLKSLAKDLAIDRRVIWPGVCADMCQVYNSLDILCSSSEYGEGFSNVIAEAMACGIPCVVTDVGDAARIVGELGLIVPPGQPEQLSAALHESVDRLGSKNDETLRARIVDNFSVDSLAMRTEAAFAGVEGGQ